MVLEAASAVLEAVFAALLQAASESAPAAAAHNRSDRVMSSSLRSGCSRNRERLSLVPGTFK
jgi:hypothetical protein